MSIKLKGAKQRLFITPKNKFELIQIIKDRIKQEGPNCDLNDIDVCNIDDMSALFYKSNFNGDISKWDVSKVIDMNRMFMGSNFNGDISKWDVSNVTNMSYMFYDSSFNGDISRWDPITAHKVSMFFHCPLENNTPKWYKLL